MKLRALAVLASLIFPPGLWAVDIPLVVHETEGVRRVQNPVNSGVPLPKGAAKDVSELRLVDAKGAVVPASIEPRCRWLGDNSLQWVTVHFLADLEPKGSLHLRLLSGRGEAAGSPISISEAPGSIAVTTGPARFVVPTDRLGPFRQVYVRGKASRPFKESDAVLSRASDVVLVARNGESKVVPRVDRKNEFKSELVRIGAPFTQAAAIRSAQVEERGPGRVVIALKGTFSTPEDRSLDFTARLYFYRGSALAQMTFSVINRQVDGMERFVGIERLAVQVPLKAAGGVRVSLPVDGKTILKDVRSNPVSLVQSGKDRLRLTSSDGTATDAFRSEGWMDVRSGTARLVAGTRWFWQVYPAGILVRPDGTGGLELKPAGTERIDLYTAGAKTHFLFFHFSRGKTTPDPAAIAAGTTRPLVAAASRDWYCQETRVMGDLYSSNPALYAAEYRDLVAQYQAHVDASIGRVVSNRPRPGWNVDEYGWLNFGSGLHHKMYVRENAAESWWDGNYYDFPHAALINYLRTGDLLNLTTAEEAGLHLADLDICHSFPGYPDRAGSPRSGPVVGHFRNYASGQNYQGHDSFTFYKNESLYELYYLTGERWYHEAGLMSSDFAMAFWGRGALRNLAHGIWGVLSAYRDTHEKRYLERARFFVDQWGKPWQDANGGSFKDQEWMYGLVFEAYDKYYRITGDTGTADYLVRALDALIAEFWKPGRGTGTLNGINLFGYGLGYEYTGNQEYFRKGLEQLEKLAQPDAEGDRVKTFAQNFRASPYFLKYLTTEYRREPAQFR
jgi:hypothetical protein